LGKRVTVKGMCFLWDRSQLGKVFHHDGTDRVRNFSRRDHSLIKVTPGWITVRVRWHARIDHEA
jgi:hypothetical protein